MFTQIEMRQQSAARMLDGHGDGGTRPAKCHRPIRRGMSRGFCGETVGDPARKVLVRLGLGIVDV